MRKRALIYSTLLLFAFNACKQSEKTYTATVFESGVSLGALSNPAIDEASGMDASIVNQGKYWTHNDSAGEPRIFLIEENGQYLGSALLEGIVNRDWEEISTGPGPEENKNYVYIGEIGDNEARYQYKLIYRIEEPLINKGDEVHVTVVDSIKFQFSDGQRDAEAFFIDQKSKDLYLFSKREKQISVYTLPYPQRTDTISIAKKLLTLPVTQITATDYDANTGELLMKNYDSVYYWKRQDQETLLAMMKRKAIVLPYEAEPQGESICFTSNGNGYLTVSEKKKGIEPVVLFYKRK